MFRYPLFGVSTIAGGAVAQGHIWTTPGVDLTTPPAP